MKKFRTLQEARQYQASLNNHLYQVWELRGKVYKYLVATELQWLNYR